MRRNAGLRDHMVFDLEDGDVQYSVYVRPSLQPNQFCCIVRRTIQQKTTTVANINLTLEQADLVSRSFCDDPWSWLMEWMM